MKNVRKLTALILCLLLALCPLAVSAGAAETNAPKLEVVISANKQSYKINEAAVITVTAKNISEDLLSEVYVYADSAKTSEYYIPLIGSSTAAYAAFLEPGDELSFSFNAMISRKADGLNFFEKIAAFFVNLFAKKGTFSAMPDSSNAAECIAAELKVSHGSAKAKISAEGIYGGVFTPDNSFTSEELLAKYNKAVVDTNKAGKIEGLQRLKLVDVSSDGESGKLFEALKPVLEKAISNTYYSYDHVPGQGLLTLEDINSISAYRNSDGNLMIKIDVKDQADGADADPDNAGPVSRAMGTLGNMVAAFDEVASTSGIKVVSGTETISLTYTDCSVCCLIDSETGLATAGKWTSNIEMYIGELVMSFNGNEIKMSGADMKFINTIEF